jgi:hypothetical protein
VTLGILEGSAAQVGASRDAWLVFAGGVVAGLAGLGGSWIANHFAWRRLKHQEHSKRVDGLSRSYKKWISAVLWRVTLEMDIVSVRHKAYSINPIDPMQVPLGEEMRFLMRETRRAKHADDAAFASLLVVDSGSKELELVNRIRAMSPFTLAQADARGRGTDLVSIDDFHRHERVHAEQLGRLGQAIMERTKETR